MIVDQVDLQILNEFCRLKENEFFKTWNLMKKIYPKGRDHEHMKIKRKIERMAKYGLFYVEGNPKTYTLDSDKVFLKKISFPCKQCLAISILIEGKFIAFEI